MDDLSGQVIKSYTLEELIDTGGFGAVYRARQSVVEREVAIKVILPQYANHPEYIRRFDTEAQLIARLEHLHIVPLYDYWRDPGGAFLVMRWLRGGNLHQALADHSQWGVRATVRLIEQIGSALAAAHQQNVIHQDLKPANILLDEEKNAYLADFGIAADLFDPKTVTHENPLLGTPLFMAPEQFTRDRPTMPQTDIYSLGIVLYVMLTGRVPFPGADVSTVIYKQMYEPIPPLQFTQPRLPQELNIVIRRATAKAPEARYPDVLSMVAELRRLALGEEPEEPAFEPSPAPILPGEATGGIAGKGSTIILQTQPIGPQNPYKGLRAFQEADAADFFGRDKLVDRLLEKLAGPGPDGGGRFMAVVGPSGSGKSSLVLAGVLPALREGHVTGSSRWYVAKMVPGARPFVEMEAALLQVAIEVPAALSERLRGQEDGLLRLVGEVLPGKEDELLLVIDQFEEVFTLVDDEAERAHFLKSLYTAVTGKNSRVRILITLRADFYDRPLLYPGFSDLVQARTEVVLPLSPSELVQAIVRPAHRAGLTIEEDLPAAIVHDVSEQPGALPLLQYTLTELFDHREGRQLTVKAYQATGGIAGALARRAEELYQQLDAGGQQAAFRLFLRLVTVSEDAEATRRRVRLAEILPPGPEEAHATVRAVMDLFARYRLLTFDHDPQTREPTVEVAHEALIKAWDRLRGWLDDSREELLAQRRLTLSTAEWLKARREASFLATGARLARFEALQESATLTLDAQQQAYLDASIALRRRTRNRIRLFVASLVLATVLAVGLALVAFDQQAQTRQQAQIARSRELAMTALTNLDQPDLSLLLSLEALQSANTLEARNSLLAALQSPGLVFLHTQADWVRTIAVSPDGHILAAGSRDGAIRLWNPETLQPLGEPLTGHTGFVNSVAFSPDGEILASGSEDGTIRLWDVAARTPRGEPLTEPLASEASPVWRVTFSPDGHTLAAGRADGTIVRWDMATGQPVGQPIAAHEGIVYGLAFSPDGRWLASGGADGAGGAVRLWDAATGALIAQHTGHVNWVLDVLFTHDGQFLLSTGVDATIKLWNLSDGSLREIRTGHSQMVRSLALSPDGSLLASASDDHTVRLWDMSTGRFRLPLLTGHSGPVWSVTFLPDGTPLSGSADGNVIFWTTVDRSPLAHTLIEHDSPVSAVALSPDGRLLAFAGGLPTGTGGDTTVRLWALAAGTSSGSGTEVAALEGHVGQVTDVVFRPDGQMMASTGADQMVWLWPLTVGANGSVTARSEDGISLIGHRSVVRSAAFRPDGAMLATASDDRTVILWDVATGEADGEPLEYTSALNAVAFSPDGRLLAAGSQDGAIILWDVATRQRVGQPLTGHLDDVTGLAFSPDGRILASSSRDTTIRLWDVATGQPLRQPLTGHADWALDVVFRPDGQVMASGEKDGLIILWDVATGRIIGEPLRGHDSESMVNSLAFSPDGRSLISGGGDAAVVLWDVDLESWQARACRVANRSLSAEEWERYFQGMPYHDTCPDRSRPTS